MNNLAYLRRELNLTQAQVAKELGVSRQAYSNYESGQREPDIAMLMKMSDFFVVTIDFILGNYTNDSVNVQVYSSITSTDKSKWVRSGEEFVTIPPKLAETGSFSALRIIENDDEKTYIFRHQDTVPSTRRAVMVREGSQAFITSPTETDDTLTVDPNPPKILGEVVKIEILIYRVDG